MTPPSFTNFGSGVPYPKYSSGISGLIQQDITQDRDPDWQVDTLTINYLIARPQLATLQLPAQFSPLSTIPTMQFWQPMIRHSRVMADVTYIYRGIMDGVTPPESTTLGIAPKDTTQLQTLQITDPTSSAVADVAFYCPQTVWRWVSLGYPAFLPTAYATINDPAGYRKPVPIRYVIRTDPGGAPSDLTGIYRTDQTSFTTERWGPYWKNEIQVAKRYASPFTS